MSEKQKEGSENKEPLTKKKKKKKKEQARRSRKRAILRNRKYVDTYKEENPCPCGMTETCCLSFHHDKGEKSGNISDMVNKGYGLARIQKEMDKCIVLCLNCHARLHNGKKENGNNEQNKS